MHKIGNRTEDRVFERFFLPIVNQILYMNNKEAKASQGGTTENERKYSILSSIKKEEVCGIGTPSRWGRGFSKKLQKTMS